MREDEGGLKEFLNFLLVSSTYLMGKIFASNEVNAITSSTIYNRNTRSYIYFIKSVRR